MTFSTCLSDPCLQPSISSSRPLDFEGATYLALLKDQINDVIVGVTVFLLTVAWLVHEGSFYFVPVV
jgi:hypothetical protein